MNKRKLKHLKLKIFLLFHLIRKQKITFKKILNYCWNVFRYFQKKTVSGSCPSVIIFEITNRCNLYCTACRHTRTQLIDQSGNQDAGIPLGEMSYETFAKVIEETAAYLLLALMYLAGEPLLNPQIFKMIKKADEFKVPTILATNGMLLNRENCLKLMEAGVDLIKIALSGYYQKTYEKEHRGGNIKIVLDNIATLVEIKKKCKAKTLIIVDYILFEHNEAELPLIQKYCDEVGIIMTIRAARTNEQKNIKSSDLAKLKANPHLCDWLWKTMSLNWDGRIFPCCEYSFWGKPQVLGQYANTATIKQIWNGEKYQKYRSAHIQHGRSYFQRCKDCHYTGIRFQG